VSDNRKYYYLKLKDNFFDSEEVKVIKGMDKGDTYVCIMLEMYLRSLKRNGQLMMTDTIPFSLKTLSSVLSRDQDEVKYAIDLFQQFNLIEVLDTGAMFMSNVQNFIGHSSTEGDRKREYRNRINSTKTKKLGHLSDVRPPEIEIELDIELKKEDIPLFQEEPVDLKIKDRKDKFHKFWEFYGYKKEKKKAEANFMKLSEEQLTQMASKVGKYVTNTFIDGTFPSRMYPARYLNPKNELWNDEVIEAQTQQETAGNGY
jgi:predicted phage replisome organizer